MTLLQTRKDFVVFSQRYDLVSDYEGGVYTDNGANFFIRAGQRWLDRRNDIYKSEARYYLTLTTGAWYALIPDCRSVRSVYMSNAAKTKWKLKKNDLEVIRADFSTDPALIDNGDPLVYSPVTLRTIAEVASTTVIDKFGATTYSSAVNHYSYDGIIWLPPASASLYLEVDGLFYQPYLSADGDMNYWTEQENFILILAACRAIEVSMRNSQGVKDWEEAIQSEILGLEFDAVDQSSSEYHELEG